MMRKWMDGLTGLTIGFLLTNHAKNYPHYVAVVDIENNKRHTYRELNDRVNRLANYLIYFDWIDGLDLWNPIDQV